MTAPKWLCASRPVLAHVAGMPPRDRAAALVSPASVVRAARARNYLLAEFRERTVGSARTRAGARPRHLFHVRVMRLFHLCRRRAHSHRSAAIGSIRVARRAGIQQASSAAAPRPAPTAANVRGALGLTSYRVVGSNRVHAEALAAPSPRPPP